LFAASMSVRGYRELPILIAALAKLDKETKKAA
jgi:hypothetical protein